MSSHIGHQELNTGLKLLHKELNTIPSKYMLRRAQTNQQKLLNLELEYIQIGELELALSTMFGVAKLRIRKMGQADGT